MPHDPDRLQEKMRGRVLGRGPHSPAEASPQQPAPADDATQYLHVKLIKPNVSKHGRAGEIALTVTPATARYPTLCGSADETLQYDVACDRIDYERILRERREGIKFPLCPGCERVMVSSERPAREPGDLTHLKLAQAGGKGRWDGPTLCGIEPGGPKHAYFVGGETLAELTRAAEAMKREPQTHPLCPQCESETLYEPPAADLRKPPPYHNHTCVGCRKLFGCERDDCQVYCGQCPDSWKYGVKTPAELGEPRGRSVLAGAYLPWKMLDAARALASGEVRGRVVPHDARLFGELYVDETGGCHFVCHTPGDADFGEVESALWGFVKLLLDQIERRSQCPRFDAPTPVLTELPELVPGRGSFTLRAAGRETSPLPASAPPDVTARAVADLIERDRPVAVEVFCPSCSAQHIDRPQPEKQWDNPPHKTHQCQSCGHEWRPFDYPTFGVMLGAIPSSCAVGEYVTLISLVEAGARFGVTGDSRSEARLHEGGRPVFVLENTLDCGYKRVS